MDNYIAISRHVMLGIVVAPLVAALIAACGGFLGRNPRRFALLFAFLHLLATTALVVLVAFQKTDRGVPVRESGAMQSNDSSFQPAVVPGDRGLGVDEESESHTTTWGLLPFAPSTNRNTPPAEIQFYIGLDGLNIWLVFLTSFLGLIAVLVSWSTILDRAGYYYAWLFALQTAVLGAFASFDIILFYVFFELTLIPVFFLIGLWGVGSQRRDAARKFFLYTLFGSLFTLAGLIGIVLENPTPMNTSATRPLPTYVVARSDQGVPVIPRAGPITFSIPRLMQNVGTWSTAKFVQAKYTATQLEQTQTAAEQARTRSAANPTDAGLAQAVALAQDAVRQAEVTHEAAQSDRDRYLRIQTWLFFAVMIGFAVKIPIVPFHTWLPVTYTEAPPAVTMLLSGVLAKLGTFGILRIVLPLTPDASLEYGWMVFGTLGAIGIIYAALCAFAQRDLKLLVAYSSVSHLGLLVIALFAFNREGITGAALHMVNHGLTTGVMFALLGFLSARYRTLDSNQYGGLMARFPGFAVLMMVMSLASVGLPGLNNFVSEMLILAGLFTRTNTALHGYWIGSLAATGIFLSAWYTMTMLRRVFFGPLREPQPVAEPVRGLLGHERVAYWVPVGLCVLLGVWPTPVLESMTVDVANLTNISDEARLRASLPVERTRRSVAAPPMFEGMLPVPKEGPGFKGVGGGGKGKGGPPGGGGKGKGGPPGGGGKGKGGPPAIFQ